MPCVLNPFTDVAMKIKQAEGVRLIAADRLPHSQTNAIPSFIIKKVRVLQRDLLAASKRRLRTGSTTELPLWLGREAQRPPGDFRQPMAVITGVMPAYANRRQISRLPRSVARPEKPELLDGDREASQGNSRRYADGVRRAFGVIGEFVPPVLPL
jgi:hypothetical protein